MKVCVHIVQQPQIIIRSTPSQLMTLVNKGLKCKEISVVTHVVYNLKKALIICSG